MSILLDALKKSEAQRQLGETPSIHSPVDVSQPSSTEIKPWLLGLMLLSVAVLLALYVVHQFDEPDLSILGYSELDLGQAQPPTAASTAGQLGDSRASTQPRTPVESFSQEQANTGEDQAEQESKARLRQSVSDYKPPPQAEPRTAQEPDRSPSRSNARSEASADSDEPSALTYWQLPQAVRDNLGELKISVLVYSASPEDRFILMGGQRLKEGSGAGGGLRLEEIRRDGALFSYRKYKFILPN